jgi:hypothetical protein
MKTLLKELAGEANFRYVQHDHLLLLLLRLRDLINSEEHDHLLLLQLRHLINPEEHDHLIKPEQKNKERSSQKWKQKQK